MGDDKDWFYMMWLVSEGFQMTVSFADGLWFQQFWWGTVKTFYFIPSSCFSPTQLPVNPLYDFRAAGSHERTNMKYWQYLSFPLVSRSGTKPGGLAHTLGSGFCLWTHWQRLGVQLSRWNLGCALRVFPE